MAQINFYIDPEKAMTSRALMTTNHGQSKIQGLSPMINRLTYAMKCSRYRREEEFGNDDE